ncbi:DUF2863 family protein [Castellaniella sp.]|uniref:DUF2863 family protein n=1 Tax=Castellaniella sp. TaxID=1955812 RepID=UPI0035617FAF
MPVRPAPLPRRAQALVALANAHARSRSRLEEAWWEGRLADTLIKTLSARHNHHTEKALEHLIEQQGPGYESLVDLAESCSESLQFEFAGQNWQALLFSAPMLAWTRYQLPAGIFGDGVRQALSDLLADAVFQDHARFCFFPHFLRFEHLPRTFQDTHGWVQTLALRALGEERDWPTLKPDEEMGELLADAFFLIGCVVVPQGEPVFKWQTEPLRAANTLETTQQRWAAGCARVLEPVFTGCQVDYPVPDAYYSSTRQADQNIRPMTLKAAATWLQTAANLPGSALQAALVACGENSIEEYRIGFSMRDHDDVIYGCVWPTLSREEARPEEDPDAVDTGATIATLLHECGIQNVRRVPGLEHCEVCEDCGTPFFPNMAGEMQHPELPEEIDPDPLQLH